MSSPGGATLRPMRIAYGSDERSTATERWASMLGELGHEVIEAFLDGVPDAETASAIAELERR